MYNSPIEIITSNIYNQIKENQEKQILTAVQKVGVNVDLTELKKALSYDRKQYSVGFDDGVRHLGSILKRLYSSDKNILITLNRLDTIIEDIINEE